MYKCLSVRTLIRSTQYFKPSIILVGSVDEWAMNENVSVLDAMIEKLSVLGVLDVRANALIGMYLMRCKFMADHLNMLYYKCLSMLCFAD